ncbi:MAG: periplasmic heavy metal sensor [Thermodesulfobacteriota bacterium]|nr:periplasmic heavy metal sensor [Thermodesulfobacteriota bacterium]
MTRKNTILIAAAALTICMISAFAYAGQGRGQGPGQNIGQSQKANIGPGQRHGGQGFGPCQAVYKDLTPEKRAVVDNLRKEHQKKVFGLRQDVQAKQAMLDALLLDPKTDEAKINKTTKELNQAQAKMLEERVAHKLKMAKETGVRMPMGHGFNAGRGHGPKHSPKHSCGSGPRWCLNN